MKDTLDRLKVIDAERMQLRTLIWERIQPFARRREYVRDSKDAADLLPPNDDRHFKNASVNWTIIDVTDATVYVEIHIDWHASYDDDSYIEVEIPVERFYASYAENSVYWANVAKADAEAQKIVNEQKRIMLEAADKKRQANKDARERALYEKLKQKLGV